MKFTAQEEYGLRCVLQVARESPHALTIPEIALREGLTQAYVGKLMQLLREAGVVESTRGQKGGYRLSRPASEMEIGFVLIALGDRLYSGDFCNRHAGVEGSCVHTTDCSIRSFLMDLDMAVQGALERMRLSDLLQARHPISQDLSLVRVEGLA